LSLPAMKPGAYFLDIEVVDQVAGQTRQFQIPLSILPEPAR